LNSGNAIGDFASGSGPAIGLNGLYYSFTLQASGVGSGTILFDSTPGANQYAADDTGFNFAPLSTGGPLDFSIAPAVTAVPEPEWGLFVVIGPVAAFAWMRRKRTI
jgi:hypothetical protein